MTHPGCRPRPRARIGFGLGLALWAAVSMGWPAGVAAAPLRLSLDAKAAPGPVGEPAQRPPVHAEPGDADNAGAELMLATGPDLPFPESADSALARDAEWLAAARTQQDDASAAADRSLGEFAPAAPAPVAVSADPLDGVTVAADGPDAEAPPEPRPAQSYEPPDRSALVWMVVPTITLAVSLAWWTGRSRGHRRKRRAPR